MNRYPTLAHLLTLVQMENNGIALDPVEGKLYRATPEQLETIAAGDQDEAQEILTALGLTEKEKQLLEVILEAAFEGV